mmetsp:Transcript_5210/g.10625  ORF Transcript_5210/g.10625 Transcript_5210/m.10625 type:complete len:196 (+) Transcript_5210:2238-2825(+)
MDVESLRSIREDSNPVILVPLGCKEPLVRWLGQDSRSMIAELGWWEDIIIGSLTFTLTPAQHWSRRSLFDQRVTLWGSWVVVGPRHRFFFAGDTGYCPVFQTIGDEFGPFDVSALPIGAYHPRCHVRAQHISPDEAFLVHRNLRSRVSVGIHWGTFALTCEHFMEPKKIVDRLDQGRRRFITMEHGEIRDFGSGS